jgi:hypothetical protein
VSRVQARATLERPTTGYDDKSGAGYPPAKTNEAGCILAQKAPNRNVRFVEVVCICIPS